MTDALPDAATEFGNRVRRRLREEVVVWLTSVGADGSPQPNPVWFVWDDDGFLIYNRPDAYRLQHVRRRPRVSLHFDGTGHGGDIVVFTGQAEIVEGEPPPHARADYVAKYSERMRRVSGSQEEFSRQYPVALRVCQLKVRGF